VPKVDGLVWKGYKSHISEDISSSQPWIDLPIAASESCWKARSFEYNKPYILEN
jgi:hypothetical protein